MSLGGDLDLIERLGSLREQGALTEEEFAIAKGSVLGTPANAAFHGYEAPNGALRATGSSVSKWVGGIAVVVLVVGFAWYLIRPPSDSQSAAIVARSDPPPAPAVSEVTNASTAQADAALEAAAEAAQAAADEVATLSSNETLASAPLEQPVVDPTVAGAVGQPSDQRGKKGRCRLNVGGRIYADGECWVRLETDGSFQVTSLDGRYVAKLIRSDGEAKAFWNASPGATRVDSVIGYMTREGACWSNRYGEICAWAD